MRYSKTVSLAEALNDYVKEMNMEHKLNEVRLVGSWEDIVGKAIGSRTSRIYIKDRILYVHLKSSIVRNELLMLREVIKSKLNEKIGEEVIKDIVLK